MGSFLCEKSKIKIVDMTPPDQCFDYLRPKGEILYKEDEGFDVILLL